MKPKPFQDIFARRKNLIKKEIPKQVIEVDYREKNCMVTAHLKKEGFEIDFKELKVADYIVKDVAIERKTISDFLSSMISKRLKRQLDELQQYPNRLLLIEGFENNELYSDKNHSHKIHSNAIRGFLLSISLKHKVPIIFTKNPEDTAKFISVLSRKKMQEFPLNPKKKTFNKREQLQYLVESFPNIGPKTARKLLKEFRTIKKILTVPKIKLQNLIGKKADSFDLINDTYVPK